MDPELAYEEAVVRIESWRRDTLDLSGLGLKSVPSEIEYLSALETLDLSDNLIASLPPEIKSLAALRSLDLSGNELESLPPETVMPGSLEMLSIENNCIESLPSSIGSLDKLRILYLRGNQLASLPPEIGSLTKLRALDLRDNKLASLPPEIGNLNDLELLLLINNFLSSLPSAIGSLTKLESLFVGENQLTSLPSEIGNLVQLEALDLIDNQLASLPSEIGSLAKLSALFVLNNPLSRELLALADDVQALKAYLQEQGESLSFPLQEVKLVFLGPPEIGKSCLLRHLQGRPFEKDSQTTIGFDVGREPLSLGAGHEEIQANCWDFGGQPKYEITHQFFFSAENLFVVAWKPRQGVAELRDWLTLIQDRAGSDAPILIVATHRDEPEHTPVALDEARFRRDFPGIRDFFWVTNLDATPDGHRDPEGATRAIQDSLSEFARMRNLLFEEAKNRIILNFPKGRQLAREQIRLVEETSMPLRECRELCAPYLPTERVGSLLTQMDAIGDVVFHPSDNDDHLVILQPEWLGKAIGFALDDPRFPPGDGEADHTTFVAIWNDHAAVEGYRPEHYPYFLWLMERFDLTYRVGERRSLVPQLVRTERPRTPFCPSDETHGGDAQCAYQWTVKGSDAPRGLIPQLTSLLSDWRGPGRQQINWKGGFFLTTAEAQRVYVELNDRALMLAVRADYPATPAFDLCQAIDAKIRAVWPGARIDLEYPCKNCLADGRQPIGSFPVSMVDEEEKSFPFVCPECRRKCTAAELKRGYSISQELREVYDRIKATQGVSAEMAAALQRVLIESTRYPNRCILAEAEGKFSDLGHDVYALHVYCDHPEHIEPVASYPVKVPKGWLKTAKGLARWTGLIAKGASLAVPGLKLVENLTAASLPDETVDLITKGASTLFGEALEVSPHEAPPREEDTDAYRRVLHGLLDSVAEDNRHYGGLHRQAQGGRVQWLCGLHVDSLPKMS